MSTQTLTLNRLEHFFVPIARGEIDREARTVPGYCYTQSTVRGDKWNLKREAMHRAGEKYMKMPAVRAMHQPIAAGHAISIDWDERGCKITAYISDDQEWRKVEDGTYRGFSIGGRPLVARGNDVDEFDWIETSLVDRPCDPGALFTVARVDGQPNATDIVPPYEVQVLDDDESPSNLSTAESISRSEEANDEHTQEQQDGGEDGSQTQGAGVADQPDDGAGAGRTGAQEPGGGDAFGAAGDGDASPAGAGNVGSAPPAGSDDAEPGSDAGGRTGVRGDAATRAGSTVGDAEALAASGPGHRGSGGSGGHADGLEAEAAGGKAAEPARGMACEGGEGEDAEGEDVTRFHPSQPRDEGGKWTIIGGHRVSIEGKAVGHNEIHAAADKFGLSTSARMALIRAHDDGHITHDDHLLRTIAHATNAAGAANAQADQVGQLHLATHHHVADALPVHGQGGSFERHWAGPQHLPALTAGKVWASPLGHHELQEGDVLHLPPNEHHGGHGGTVAKVSAKSVTLEYDHSGIQGGHTVKKSDLKGRGYVMRGDKVHHLDEHKKPHVSHAETPDLLRFAAGEMADLAGGGPGHWPVGERHQAVNQIAGLLHGMIGGGVIGGGVERLLDSDDVAVRENLEGGRREAANGTNVSNTADALVFLRERLGGADAEDGGIDWLRSTLKAALAMLGADDNELPVEREVDRADNDEGSADTLSRLQTVEGELSRVLGEGEVLRADLEGAKGEVTRLQGDLSSAQKEVSRLKALPLKKTVPMQYPGAALPRDFAANGVLRSEEAAREEAIAALKQKRTEISAQTQAETDSIKRTSLVAQGMSLDYQIAQLS